MPLWLRFFQVGPEHAVLLTLALPLAVTIWKVWQRVRDGASNLVPSLHFLIALGATLAAGMSRPFQFAHGIHPPLSDIPLYISGVITLWLAPGAARAWYKKPEAKQKKRFSLPRFSLDRALPGLPLPGILGAAIPEAGDGADGKDPPKLERVRAGRLDFRVLWGMVGVGIAGLVIGNSWLSGTIDLNVGFWLLVMCGGGLILLSRYVHRDTFLVEAGKEKSDDDNDDDGDGFRLELPGGDAPLPSPVPPPAQRPAPLPSPPTPPVQRPTAMAGGAAKFGKRVR
jgi:hypothetical protein